MKSEMNFILMADIIRSRDADQGRLMTDFKEIVSKVNHSFRDRLLSPVTITLGDEFQGVVRDLSSALAIILQLEEIIIRSGKNFKLRYVLAEGKIETAINTKIAYEMLGSGLSEARETLAELKKMKARFYVMLQDKAHGEAINNVFIVLQNIIDTWKIKKDYYIVAKFLEHKDYKKVATELNKERSLIWKRERSLNLADYFALKEVITYLGGK